MEGIFQDRLCGELLQSPGTYAGVNSPGSRMARKVSAWDRQSSLVGTLFHVDKVDLLGPSSCAAEAEELSLGGTITGDCGGATPPL